MALMEEKHIVMDAGSNIKYYTIPMTRKRQETYGDALIVTGKQKEMVEIDNWIEEFKNQVDEKTRRINSIQGEDGTTTRVMYNDETKTYYYLSYISEFFYSFGRIFNKPGKIGESIDEPKLKHALQFDNCWIVICKPVDKQKTRVRFYGCLAKDWYNYCIENHTINTPRNRVTANWSVEVQMLRNMEGFSK